MDLFDAMHSLCAMRRLKLDPIPDEFCSSFWKLPRIGI